ncbi:transmembrane protein [Spiroplasma clarkii]|uniref:Transmembrane protein n=1 Tax=Spiroplasma clarkii TaxID=2139 RepID=A0A1Y0L2V2_9MOLU|nr:hypothetical protein [Spiroplasma clarkii]ARU92038.1 transmembrane protein [Spiroplasma clarkii]ATX71368.1 hypothetical protein SCLAR_v1c10680 [Spiroplasma clarkii]
MKNNLDDDISSNPEHAVLEHDIQGDKLKRDHYHGTHHFDKRGNHDDVAEGDFHFKESIYTSQRNLIYRITLTGVFLALAIGGTSFDIFLEFVRVPVAGVNINFRYFDLLFILLSIGSIGPFFTSIIAAVVPWMHILIDNVHGHTVYDALIDLGGYVTITWILWIFYYVLFRNSYTHKDPNRKRDLFKRWSPMPFFVIACALLYTGLIIGVFHLNGAFANYNHATNHQSIESKMVSPHSDEHEHEMGEFNGKWGILIIGVFGFEALRFSACFAVFAMIEPQVKKLNHRYK